MLQVKFCGTLDHKRLRLLETRFGTELQAERFKAELRTRRRKPGEPLQQLYQEVCRLVAHTYPLAEASLTTHVAKEAFVTALNDSKLQLEVMKREARNIEESLSHATKLEAYEQSLLVQGNSDEMDERRVRRRPRNVYTVADPPEADESTAIRKQLKDLQDAVTQVTQGMAAMAAASRSGQAVPPITAPCSSSIPNVVAAPAAPPFEQPTSEGRSGREGGRGRRIRRRLRETDPCRRCGQLGHWAKECSQRKVQPVARQVECPRVASTCVYVKAKFRNRPIRCLLDSGCERSIVGRRYVRDLRLRPTQYRLSAANKAALPIDGDIDLHFTIDGYAMTASVSVSPAIDDLLLGSDWLVENGCRWDFAAGTIHIGDRLIHTHQRKHVDLCRRIMVSEECVVPPRHEANVPARMIYDHTQGPATDWVVEPRVIRPGVVAARTLVSGDSMDVVARVCNYSDTPHVFREDSLLSLAEPVGSGVVDSG